MASERTEQKILRNPITVTLGGKEYQVKPLVIKDAREWRRKMSGLLGRLPGYVSVTADDSKGFQEAVNAMMSTTQDEMIDLFFGYAKDLDRAEIESSASEIELAEAFRAITAVAFPLVRSLTGAFRTALSQSPAQNNEEKV